MQEKVNREALKRVLEGILKTDVPEHNLVLATLSACAWVFAHVSEVCVADRKLLQQAYLQIEKEGSL